jgi:hypothetical protein
MTILQSKSNQPFENADSRLERQIYTVLNEGIYQNDAQSLTGTQREQLIGELIKQYDPATDNLSPITNPNAKPMDLEAILTNFEIDADKVLPKVLKTSGDEKQNW